MTHILAIIVPVFAVVAVGYLAARWGWLSAADNSGISKFVFVLALPLLLFDSLANLESPGVFRWQFLLSFFAGSFIVYALGYLLSKWLFGAAPKEQAVFGLGGAYSNMVLIGLPVVSAAFGEAGLLPMLILISLHSVLLFSVFLLLMERGDPGDWLRQLRFSARQLMTNPLILGLLAGVLARALGLGLPGPLAEAVHIIGQAALPCSLIVLGASLREYKIGGELGKAWVIVALKLLAQPLIVWALAFHVFELEPLWAAVAVIAAALPVGVNAYIMAEQYQVGRATISTAILVSTLLSVVTQSLLLSILL
ncbi:MAG: AEC family transporter [Anaerolineales bacterium]|nr:AEC family transporter [Anaerolineales bacterium]MCW5856142.1 AEC family transporter [Anaerolineales bacterium]